MAIPVLLLLAGLWAAVLVPPVLRSRSESRRKGPVGDSSLRFSSHGGRRSRRSSGSRAGRSLHAVPAPTRSRDAGRAENGARRVARGSRLIASGPPAPRATIRQVAHPRVPPRRELAPLAADSSLPRVAAE